MRKGIISLVSPLVVGIIALALGWFAHAAVPLSAQAIGVEGRATLAEPAAPAAPAGIAARLTYQGRLTGISGVPVNSPVSMTFRIYSSDSDIAIWTSATRSVTPANGLFTVYLGDGADPDLGFPTLLQAASIGVTVGADAEMSPRQALHTLVGHSQNSYGVVGGTEEGTGVYGRSSGGGWGVHGSTISGFGVIGRSTSGVGVYGTSIYSTAISGKSSNGIGVYAATNSPTQTALYAWNLNQTGAALEIGRGGIKAADAGIGSNTFAFIHQSSVANIVGNTTRITNALTNGDQNAMLFVTHVFNPTGVAANFFNKAFGVYYNSNASQWAIYTEDDSGIPAGVTFNVMVIKR